MECAINTDVDEQINNTSSNVLHLNVRSLEHKLLRNSVVI